MPLHFVPSSHPSFFLLLSNMTYPLTNPKNSSILTKYPNTIITSLKGPGNIDCSNKKILKSKSPIVCYSKKSEKSNSKICTIAKKKSIPLKTPSLLFTTSTNPPKSNRNSSFLPSETNEKSLHATLLQQFPTECSP